MKAIEVSGLQFGYGRTSLFQGFDLEVRAGEFLSVIGPNGAGKSSLLRLMAGLVRPWAGQVRVLGRSLGALSRRRAAQLIAVVLDEVSFQFNYPVREVVLMGRSPYLGTFQRPGRRDLDRVEQALELCDIAGLADQGIVEVSAGERQRAVLARALAQETEVLLLDEAFSHLDIAHQVSIARILEELNRAGRTIVLLSHDLNLAASLGSRVLLLSQGRAAAIGTPAEVLKPEKLKSVYGVEPVVLEHPESGRPQVLLPAG